MAIITTALVSFFVTAFLGKWLIPLLKKLSFGQTILEIGPNWHKDKQGTPTMGGIMFVVGITVAVVAGFFVWLMTSANQITNLGFYKLFAGLLMALGYGAVGFVDDYIKVVKKQNLGLTSKQKMLLQLLVAGIYLSLLYMIGSRSTIFIVPFLGQINFGIFYYPVAMFIIVGTVNAVNLTDGIDGLAGTVTFVVGLGFMFIANLLTVFSMTLMATALAGGCLGFLVWNFHPAKVFMGDTGSLFLGGMVVSLAFGIEMPFLLLFMGIIYIVETASVMIQVAYFKATGGKRIFKMTPIHHHFEMSKWSEYKIVMVFSFVTLLGVLLSILAVYRI